GGVDVQRGYSAALWQSLAALIGSVVTIDRAGADINETPDVRPAARPIQHAHRAHQVAVYDASRVFHFGLSFLFRRAAARDRRHRSAVHDARNLVPIQRIGPAGGI